MISRTAYHEIVPLIQQYIEEKDYTFSEDIVRQILNNSFIPWLLHQIEETDDD